MQIVETHLTQPACKQTLEPKKKSKVRGEIKVYCDMGSTELALVLHLFSHSSPIFAGNITRKKKYWNGIFAAKLPSKTWEHGRTGQQHLSRPKAAGFFSTRS